MARVNSSNKPERGRPALSPEAREKQLVALAMDRAEEQLRAGTASSQVIAHFLKLGSQKYELENARLIEENKMLRAKTEALESQKELKVVYEEALKAMRNYAGYGDAEEYDD